MCTLVFSYRQHPKFPLIVASNRDEFYHRPAARASFWPDQPDLLAGRDLQNGGTWLGITKTGRFSALTNVRDMQSIRTDAPSRGDLVLSTLLHPSPDLDLDLDSDSVSVSNPDSVSDPSPDLVSDPSPDLASDPNPDSISDSDQGQDQNPYPDALHAIHASAHQYNGFNLITGTLQQLYYYSNVHHQTEPLKPGTYVMSNAFLNTPWPKSVKTKTHFEALLRENRLDANDLFALMKDNETFPPELLPNTGLSKEMEIKLSSTFIHTETYGTRCTTLLKIDSQGRVWFSEKTYEQGEDAGTTTHEFSISASRPFDRSR